jgi:COP9 signalosome complex subunit 6
MGKAEVIESTSGLNVILHPLVIINVSDHSTRTRIQAISKKTEKKWSAAEKTGTAVYGALLGTQEGRTVEIHTSFEVCTVMVDKQLRIDVDFVREKSEQYAQVFPKYELLGWYTCGKTVLDEHKALHQQAMECLNDNPLFVLVDHEPDRRDRELPVFIYEGILGMRDDRPSLTFANLTYKVESEESERISVDHIAHMGHDQASSGQSSLVAHGAHLYNAVKMLQMRIQVVYNYLKEANRKGGALAQEHQLLRAINSLCNRLPTMDSEKFSDAYANDFNDAQLIVYLSALTKCANQLNDTVDRFNFAYEKSRRRAFF